MPAPAAATPARPTSVIPALAAGISPSSAQSSARPPSVPHPLPPYPRKSSSTTPAPPTSVIPALALPSYPRLPRVSRRVLRRTPRGLPASLTPSRHTRANLAPPRPRRPLPSYPRSPFRHTRACRGYLAEFCAEPRAASQRLASAPHARARPTSVIPTRPPPSYPRLPRVSRRVLRRALRGLPASLTPSRHHTRANLASPRPRAPPQSYPRPTAVIPAPPTSVIPALAAGISPSSAQSPARPPSVPAPIWRSQGRQDALRGVGRGRERGLVLGAARYPRQARV